MNLPLRRIAGLIGILAAAVAAAAYPSLQQARYERQEQEQSALALEQRLADELRLHSSLRHVGDLFPHGR